MREPAGGPSTQEADGPVRMSVPASFPWFLATYFLLNFGQGVFPTLLPALMRDLALGFTTAGLLGTAFGAARFAVALPAGHFVERRGLTVAVHVSNALLLAGTLLSAAAPGLGTLLVGRALVGAGSGGSVLVAILYLMRAGAPSARVQRGSVYEIAVTGATAVASYLAGAAAARMSWRIGFAMAALAIAAGWVIEIRRVLPDATRLLSSEPQAPVTAPASPARAGSAFAIYLAIFALAVGWAGAISTFLPLYGGSGLGLSTEAVGRAMAIAFGVELLLLVPMAWAASRVGRAPILTVGMTAMLSGVALLPFAQSVTAYTVAAALVVQGLTVWMIPPALLAERRDFSGKAAGFYRFVSDAGAILAPVGVGWAVGTGGFGLAALLLGTIFAAAIAGVVARLWPRRS